nr:taste receptor type 2 member 40-like [Zootoca vivipara]
MILSCLSLFRLAFLAIVIQNAIFLLFFKDTFQKRDVFIAFDASWAFVNTADLWFATWLSILYCVKITNFSHPLFLQMKRRFPGLVPWLLLGTVVFSAIVTTVTVTGMLTSLWRHKNLLHNTARDVSTEAHLNAIKALASFSILYVSNFCMEFLDIVLFWMDSKDDWITIILFNVIALYSSGHAIILIFVNPKLKRELIKMLHQLQC